MRKHTFLAAAGLILLAAFVPASAADINGKWTSEFDSQIGRQSYTFDFKVDGTALTGKATHNQRGATEIKEGKVNGDEIFFVELANIQGQELRIEYRGKVSGDEIKFRRKVADITEYEVVAKRAK
jgi:hypothetical protein